MNLLFIKFTSGRLFDEIRYLPSVKQQNPNFRNEISFLSGVCTPHGSAHLLCVKLGGVIHHLLSFYYLCIYLLSFFLLLSLCIHFIFTRFCSPLNSYIGIFKARVLATMKYPTMQNLLVWSHSAQERNRVGHFKK